MESCIFCKIARGKIPSYKLYEDDDAFVFLDAFPIMKGQTLIIPKKHLVPYMFDIDDETYIRLMLVAKKLAKAIDKALKPVKTGLVVEGLELDHIHIKLYPLSRDGFRHYNRPLEPRPSDKEMKEIAEKIKKAL